MFSNFIPFYILNVPLTEEVTKTIIPSIFSLCFSVIVPLQNCSHKCGTPARPILG